jgi:crotonobetainyl-CoA:carnitine CoA-transferase CaiB-like acyl-CoA transferase
MKTTPASVHEIRGPLAGIRVMGMSPARFSRLKPAVHGTAPRLGEHTVSNAAETGITGNEWARMVSEGADRV